VKFKPGVTPDRIAAILKEHRTELIREIQGTRTYKLRIVTGEAVESVVKRFSALQEVEYAEPVYVQSLHQ
jgi:hypothetical protein